MSERCIYRWFVPNDSLHAMIVEPMPDGTILLHTGRAEPTVLRTRALEVLIYPNAQGAHVELLERE